MDLAVTLDGFISGPDGEIHWIVKDEERNFCYILENIFEGRLKEFYKIVDSKKSPFFQQPGKAMMAKQRLSIRTYRKT